MITFLGYEEIIKTLNFRNQSALKIPKEVREIAYTLAVDIEIKSVARDGYKNYKSNPSHGFYGYAILVMQDFTELKIEIENSRQRLYYGTLPSAFVNWYQFYLFNLVKEYWKFLFNTKLQRLESAAGVSVPASTFDCAIAPSFIELPLREIYIKCANGTSYEIEVSHYRAKPVDYEGCLYSGKSNQTDGDKDTGLPSTGVNPKVALNPNDPFNGLPPVSNNADLGAYRNDKGSSLEVNIAGTWTLTGVFRDWQNIGEPFDYSVVAGGFAYDNPVVSEQGYVSPACPYKTFVKSTFDNRNMMDIGCSSKVISQSFVFTPL